MLNVTKLSLALVFTGALGCSADNTAPASSSGLAPEVGAAADEAPEVPAPDAGWTAGDTIPSGKANVPDIRILAVHNSGSGEVCGSGKKATLKYKAMLADGKVLDPGTRPFTFRVGAREAIEGWDIVVAKMRIGDSFTILLPQDLAYGSEKGDLKFDMELLSFE